MSDRPPITNTPAPDEPEVTGGWQKPSTAGGWQKPAVPSGGWQKPAAPARDTSPVSSTPAGEGAWFRPADDSESTSVEEVMPAAEAAPVFETDTILPLDPLEEEVVEELAPLPFDDGPTSTSEPEQEEPAEENAFAAALEAAVEAAPEITESTVVDAANEDLNYSDDEDEDTFSMSELVALASLVEGTSVPSVQSPMAASETLSPAERALMQSNAVATDAGAANDPGEYARRQIEALSGTGSAAAGNLSAMSAEDQAAEYARRQIEALSGTGSITAIDMGTGAQVPAAQQPPVDPAREALAQKFLQTEGQIKTLRSAFQSGQLTREQMQEQLRGLMILDDQQRWWMMGVETDTWYVYQDGQWVPSSPPRPTPVAPQRAGAPATLTSDIDPSAVIQGSLPYLPTSEELARQGDVAKEATAFETGGIRLGSDYMPLPRQVPVSDPDYTVPNTGGIYLNPVRSSEAATLEATQPVQAGYTVASPTVRMDPYAADAGAVVASPIPGQDPTIPPDYNLDQVSPTYQDAVQRRRSSTAGLILRLALVAVGLLLILMTCGAVGAAAYYSSLASEWTDEVESLANYVPQFQTARILDANGELLVELNSQERGAGARTRVPLDQISPFMIHAIVSVENERFFIDPGWDPIAIGRAFLQNLSAGGVESGASTITQQIARNLILQDSTVSANRKINEIVIAAEIGQRYDKNFILELYLNEFFFGNQSYGVEAASQFYFGHSANDLTLPESALLAGLLQAPASYDPVINREASFDRMDEVLRRMQEVECLQFLQYTEANPFCITPAIVRSAIVQKAEVEAREYRPRSSNPRYPHFVNFVQAQLETNFGSSELFKRGFTVRTTINPRVQDVAQAALTEQIALLQSLAINSGTIMVTDPRDGAIRAMIGSPNFNDTQIDGQVNVALTWQQPGSSIKPILYTAALEGVDRGQGFQYYTPATILWDVPTAFQANGTTYQPTNFDNRFHGAVPLRFALGNSYNIPAVKTFDFIGPEKFVDIATRMGLQFLPDTQVGLPTGIGATEVRLYDMMQAYGTLANNGQRIPLYAIVSITDSDGNNVPLPERAQPVQAVQPQVAYLMQSILSDDSARAAAFGLNSPLTLSQFPGQVAAKTGTSNDNRDLWTMGFTRNAVVGIWLGRPDNQPTRGQGAFLTTATLWNRIMVAALQSAGAPEQFVPPAGIVPAQICETTGTLAGATCARVRNELFISSQPPPAADQSLVRTAQVDSWTGLIANQFCPDNVITGTFAAINDASAVAWLNTTAEGQRTAQELGLPTPLEIAPTAACDVNSPLPRVVVNSPTPNQAALGTLQVTGTVAASNFNRYQIEVASAAAPDQFSMVSGPFTAQQTGVGALLGTWDTTQVPNGQYIVRLAAFANNGGYVYRTIPVTVNNPLPTPTIAPTATFPVFSSTPLPFDPLTPAAPISGSSQSAQFGPTPTATINAAG